MKKSQFYNDWLKKKLKINKDSLRDLWENINHTNILIMEIPERGEKKGQRADSKK